MAMHYRRHNPAAGGRANPFTGRSLPTSNAGGGGRDYYHGNTPSVVPNMTKKAVLLVLTFTVFFYVIFAPDYDDGSYEMDRSPSIKKKESASNSDAINKSFVDLSKEPQSEPVKLKLPSEITPDPDDNNDFDNSEFEREEERQVESPDFEDHRIDEEEDEDEDMKYNNSNDPDEDQQSMDGEDNVSNDTLAETDALVLGDVHPDELQDSEDQSQSDPFLGLGSTEEKEDEEEESALDSGHGGLRGSNKPANDNPFGRQDVTEENESKVEEDEGQGVESSADNDTDGDVTFYKNQSPLEVPMAEDESAKSKDLKSMGDEIGQRADAKLDMKPCLDDPEFRYKGIEGNDCEYISEKEKCDKLHNGEPIGIVSCPVACNMVNECLERLNQQDKSHDVGSAKTVEEEEETEGFSIKEKAAFDAKYGSASKSMEEEIIKQDALKNEPPLEVPIADAASDITQSDNVMSGGGLSMAEYVDEQPKSMADELGQEDKDSGDEVNETKVTEGSVNSLKADDSEHDKEEEKSEDNEMMAKDTSGHGDGTDQASKVDKVASSVENKFKEYLITNSEDEPNKDPKTEDVETPLEGSKDEESTSLVKDDNIGSNLVEDKKSDSDEQEKTEDTDEALKNNEGSYHASEQEGDDAEEDSIPKRSKFDSKEVKKDVADSNEESIIDVGGDVDAEDEDESLKKSEENNDAEENSPKKTVADKESKYDSEKVEMGVEDNSHPASQQGNAGDKDLVADRSDVSKSNNDAEEVGNDADISSLKGEKASKDAKEALEDTNELTKPDGDDAEEDTEPKKPVTDENANYDSQEVGKVVDDNEALSSPREVLTNTTEEDPEDTNETLKNNDGSDNASKQVDHGDSSARKSKSTLDADKTNDTKKEKDLTLSDVSIKKSGDSSDQGEHADEESKVKAIDSDNSKDTPQEVEVDLGGSQVSNQIDKSEDARESVEEEAKGSGDDVEKGDTDVISEAKKASSVETGVESGIGDTEKDAEQAETGLDDSKDANAAEQNEEEKSLDNAVDASKDVKQDDTNDVSEKLEGDIKYAKIASDKEEPKVAEDGSDDTNIGEKEKTKAGESDSPLAEDEGKIPIEGDLGEAIKESDAPESKEDIKLDPQANKHDTDEGADKQKKDEEIDAVVDADTKESIVGEDNKTAKISRKKKD